MAETTVRRSARSRKAITHTDNAISYSGSSATARRSARRDILSAIPIELIAAIASSLDPPSLISLSTTSKLYRSVLVNKQASAACTALWRQARESKGLVGRLASYEGLVGEVRLAHLIWGPKRCRVCGKAGARRVDFHLRVRLCPECYDTKIIPEGPDEPDPAFVGYFPGTKRYAPRLLLTTKGPRRSRVQRAFFFVPALESTSTYLQAIFEPHLPSAEVDSAGIGGDEDGKDDGLEPFERLWLHPPEDIQEAFEDRARWLALNRMDAELLEHYSVVVANQEAQVRRGQLTWSNVNDHNSTHSLVPPESETYAALADGATLKSLGLVGVGVRPSGRPTRRTTRIAREQDAAADRQQQREEENEA